MPQRITPEVLTTPIDWHDPKILGYHATSIQAYRVLKSTRSLPPTPYDADEITNTRSYLHFYPTYPNRRNQEAAPDSHVYNSNYMMLRYAAVHGSAHYIIEQLNLDRTDVEASRAAWILAEDLPRDPSAKKAFLANQMDALRSINPKGEYSQDYLLDLIISSKNRRGLVLAISSKTPYPIEDDPNDNLAKRLYVPNGLEIEFIPSVRPLGDFESDQLMSGI